MLGFYIYKTKGEYLVKNEVNELVWFELVLVVITLAIAMQSN